MNVRFRPEADIIAATTDLGLRDMSHLIGPLGIEKETQAPLSVHTLRGTTLPKACSVRNLRLWRRTITS